MLTETRLNHLLARLPDLTLGVLGDLFLDRYLDMDAALNEPSLETGLTAYQVVRVRCCPGAAGTVINNLAALGVGRILPVAVIGDDGEGYELRRALQRFPCVAPDWLIAAPDRRTPTYTKPMLAEPGAAPRELNRLDIKNRSLLSAEMEERVLEGLAAIWPRVDALLVLDQVSEADCGVVTSRVRQCLAELGTASPEKVILADSRERIGQFRSVWLKPNQAECRKAAAIESLETAAERLARHAGRPVLCTCGERGTLIVDARVDPPRFVQVPAYPVSGPIDPVGAGDSTSAGIASALAAGRSVEEAAAFGNLVASITIQQVGTTGTATPQQVRDRWREAARSS